MRVLPEGCRLIDLETTASTNDDARKLAQNGGAEGTVVRAAWQTQGRGRSGRVWESARGNLFMSLVLCPDVSALKAGQLSFVVALGLARALDLPGLKLKWPNDVLVNGKKIAGILLESELKADGSVAWVVVGIGVNIASAPEGATCVNEYGQDVSRDEVFYDIMHHLMKAYKDWQKNGFPAVRKEWLERAYNKGKSIVVRLPREKFDADFVTIDDAGALVVRLPDGSERTVTSADVFA